MKSKQQLIENSDAPNEARTQRPSPENELGRFAERLESILKGRSARSFAREAGVSETVFRKYLAGTSEPTRPALIAMASAGGVTAGWLAVGEGIRLASDQSERERDAQLIAFGDPAAGEVREAWARRDQAVKDWSAGYSVGMASDGPSQVMRLDREIFVEAVKLVQAIYQLTGATYRIADDPDLLMDVYAFLAENGGKASPADVIDFSKRLADRRRAKESNDARQGEPGQSDGPADTGKGARGRVPGEGDW